MGKRFHSSSKASGHTGASRREYGGTHSRFLGFDLTRWALPYLAVALLQGGVTILRHTVFTTNDVRLGMVLLVSLAGWGLIQVINAYSAARHEFIGPHMRLTVWTLIGTSTVTLILGWPFVWRCVCPVALGTLCLSWSLRRTDALREREGSSGKDRESDWDRLGWENVKPVGKLTKEGPSWGITARGVKGRTAKSIIAGVDSVTAHLGLRPGAITAVPDPDNAAQVRLSITPEDHLKGDSPRPPWSGERYSFAEGVPLGIFEHGVHFRLTLIRGLLMRVSSHLQIMAMSQAGKSHLFQLFVRGLTETHDAVLWVGDPVKAAETFPGILPACDRAEITADGVNKMLKDLERIITYRTRFLSQVRINGERITGWQPGCGLPIIIAWIEESHAALAGSETWANLAKAALSSGIILIDSTQRADHEAKKTSARSQYSSNICGGVNSETDQAFILPGYIADQVKCYEWGTKYPGRFIADCVCIPDDLKVRPWRTYFSPGMQRENEAAIRANAPGMAQLDEGSRAVCNDYAQHPDMRIFGWTDEDGDGEPDVQVIVQSVRPERSVQSSVQSVPSGRTDVPAVRTVEVVRPEPMFTTGEEEAMNEPTEDDVREAVGIAQDERTVWDDVTQSEREALAQAEADLSAELPPAPPGVSWPAPEGPELTTEQHRDVVRVALISMCQTATQFSRDRYPMFKMEHLMDRVSGVPGFLRSRPWVHDYVRILVEAGDLKAVGGGWYAVLFNPELDPIPTPERDNGAKERIAALFD